jgi:NAD(P)-dependent dehydrogenase (short-subunit alcohol dehydrogenase family)
MMRSLIQLCAVVAVLLGGYAPAPVDAQNPDGQKAVLVTGASSGIGRKVTEVLAERGHFVYAGARKDADLAELDKIPNVKSVRLDVTEAADISAAVALIEKEGRGLYGIVNNAGVGVFSPMNETPEKDIDFVFDVNVYGPYRINKAFTPMLVESGGRTTTIGSISGFISGPNFGTYSMSKFAVEAYTDALAEEMAESGVHVSVVEPGSYKSRIREKVTMHALGKGYRPAEAASEEEEEQLAQAAARNDALKEPDEVADAVVHALFAENPKRRYMVAPDEEQAEITIRTALSRVVQLNADQPYEYSRDELVALLDSLLAGETENAAE